MAETMLEKLKREKAEKEKANGTPPAAAAAPKVDPPKTPAPAAPRTPPAVNPPESGKAPATVPAGLDLSPLVKAIQELAAKHAPIDLRDQIAIAICSSGDPTAIEGAYELADVCLKGRTK